MKHNSQEPFRAHGERSLPNELKTRPESNSELIDFVPAIVWRANAQTFQFTFVSRYAETLLGYPLQRWTDEPTFWRDQIYSEDLEWAIALRSHAAKEGGDYDVEYRMVSSDGRALWVRELGRALAPGSTEVLAGVIVDLSKKRSGRQALGEDKRWLRQVIDTIPQQIWSCPADGSLDFCNARMLIDLGLSLEDMQGDGWQRVLHPDERDRVINAWQESVVSGTPYGQEQRLRMANGQFRWFLCRGVPQRDDHGNITRWFGSTTDIEDQKQAENALRKSEQRWRQVFDNTRIGVAVLDASLHFVDANEAYQKMMGYSADELRSMKPMDVTFAADRPSYQHLFDEMSVGKRDHFDIEKRNLRRDGESAWVRANGSSFGSGESRLWIVMVTDIGERKRTEEALRTSERRQFEIAKRLEIESARLVEAQAVAKVGSWEVELPSLEITWSDQTHRIFETDPLHFRPRRPDFVKLVHPEDREKVDAAFEASLEKRTPSKIEYRIVLADGRVKILEENWKVFRDEQGRPLRLIGTCQDITERKHDEAALRYSEEKYRVVVETVSDAVASIDESGNILLANPATTTIFGYESSELIGQPLTILMPEYLRELHNAGFKRYLDTGQRHMNWQGTELIGRRKDGEEFPVEVSFGELSKDGRRVFTGIIRDIRNRKRAEEALRKSEERWRSVFENSAIGVALTDLNGRFLATNQVYQTMVDYTEEELRALSFLDLTHEDYREANWAFVTELLEGKRRQFQIEKKYRRKDGNLIWVSNNVSLVPGTERVPRFIMALSEDITERKRLGDQLEQERDRLRLLLDLTHQFASKLNSREFFDTVVDGVRRVAGWDAASILLPAPSSRDLTVYLSSDNSYLPEGYTLPIDGSLQGDVYRSGKPIAFGIEELPDLCSVYRKTQWMQDLALAKHIRAGCALPLIHDRQVMGVFFLMKRAPQAPAKSDLIRLQELANLVATSLGNALRYEQVNESREKLAEAKNWIEDQIRAEFSFETVVGVSQPIRNVLQQVETVAPTDSTVLILGETGTGKELIARAIHDRSPRSDQSFIKVDCSAIPGALMESEFFGHEKGAFTGATAQRLGRFEIADKGTLFLDEVGDIPLELQPKLLRVLQDQAIERLGSNRTRHLDVRIIAATNRNLEQMVEKGEFREDLYYRLKVFPITIPPLRERPEDIPPLVRHYVAKYAQRMKKEIKEIPAHALEVFTRYPWPGNVRELQHFLERSVVLSPGNVLQAPLRELEQVIHNRPIAGKPSPARRTMEEIEREAILQALWESNWVVGGPHGAAAKLGLKRTTLASRMESLGISRHGR